MKKALILDLDNTIYPVSAIAANLFEKLFDLLDHNFAGFDVKAIKEDMTRLPYHLVADKFAFDDALKAQCITVLNNITYDMPMQALDGYHAIKSANILMFLVTMGFTKLQWSKIKMLGIGDDFEEIHVVDPEISQQTKKDVFADILKRHNYAAADVLVIGDDPESEIRAALELGIDALLFDPEARHTNVAVTYRAMNLSDTLIYL